MRLSRPLAAALVALSGLVVVGAGGPTSAQDDAGGCGPGDVTVVVDAEELGGEVEARCTGALDPATMLEAYGSAGFTVEGTTEFGASVVCRVDGAPAPDAEPCDAMPSADAY